MRGRFEVVGQRDGHSRSSEDDSGDSAGETNESMVLDDSTLHKLSRRVVRFALDEKVDEASSLNFKNHQLLWAPSQSLTVEELRVRLDLTNQKLMLTQIDLSAERALRRRKETAILKLAMELNKRTVKSERKSQKINQLDGSLRDMERKLESALVVASAQFGDEKCNKLRNELRQAKESYEQTITELRRHVLELSLQNELLNEQLLGLANSGSRMAFIARRTNNVALFAILFVSLAILVGVHLMVGQKLDLNCVDLLHTVPGRVQ